MEAFAILKGGSKESGSDLYSNSLCGDDFVSNSSQTNADSSIQNYSDILYKQLIDDLISEKVKPVLPPKWFMILGSNAVSFASYVEEADENWMLNDMIVAKTVKLCP